MMRRGVGKEMKHLRQILVDQAKLLAELQEFERTQAVVLHVIPYQYARSYFEVTMYCLIFYYPEDGE
jgi:hypothetical protein